MLILTRSIGEKIMVGDDIQIVVLDVNTKQIKLGIAAPQDLTILREELYFDRGSRSAPNEEDKAADS